LPILNETKVFTTFQIPESLVYDRWTMIDSLSVKRRTVIDNARQIDWIEENIEGRCVSHVSGYYFELQSDATMFLLRFA